VCVTPAADKGLVPTGTTPAPKCSCISAIAHQATNSFRATCNQEHVMFSIYVSPSSHCCNHVRC
jgi:hypothetical protein